MPLHRNYFTRHRTGKNLSNFYFILLYGMAHYQEMYWRHELELGIDPPAYPKQCTLEIVAKRFDFGL